MNRRLFLPGAMLLALMFSPGIALAQTSTPGALDLVESHFAWGIELLGGGADDLTVEEVEEHLDPALLEHYPAEQFIDEVQQLTDVLGPLELVEDLSDPDNPAMFRGLFRSELGIDVIVMVEIDPETGLITNLDVAMHRESHLPATPAGTPAS